MLRLMEGKYAGYVNVSVTERIHAVRFETFNKCDVDPCSWTATHPSSTQKEDTCCASCCCYSELLSLLSLPPERRRRRRLEGRDNCRMNNNMSAVDQEEAEPMMCCASCGKAEVDNVKLKMCTACKLVKYCSVDCQKNHRPQHKKACKKRAAEIKDDRLFTQPDGNQFGECPICCLPLPLIILNRR